MNEEDEEFNRIEREAKQRMEAVSAALAKKAENARELGLDYEPAQQEPVAIALNTGTKQGVKWLKNVEHGESLYTTPQPAQRTWVEVEQVKWEGEKLIAKLKENT